MTVREIFNNKRIILFFWIANIVSLCIAFSIANQSVFPDQAGYLSMADGLSSGKFTSWPELSKYYPETLRTPGYPVMVYLLQRLVDSTLFIKIIQVFTTFISLIIGYKIVCKLSVNNIAGKIFLLITAFNLQIYFYSGYISSDSLSIFFVLLYAYLILFRNGTLFQSLICGIIGGIAFQIRPSFLLVPLIILIFNLFNRISVKYSFIHFFIFLLTLIPFGFWNLNNHGVFKVTPLEGGAGIASMGFWGGILPDGYTEKFYWGNFVATDITQPQYCTEAEKKSNVFLFEKEWRNINSQLKKYETPEDSVWQHVMRNLHSGKFILHNSQYTIEREKLLWLNFIRDIKENKAYYLTSRIHSFTRLYFTGIREKDLATVNSFAGVIKITYPFIVTFVSIFLGLIFSVIFIFWKRFQVDKRIILLIIISLYYGISHCIFATQSRYAIAIHFLIIISTSLILSGIIENKRNTKKTIN